MSADMAGDAADLWGRGFSLIPVHRAEHGHCSCGDPRCSSPGKHPEVKWERYQKTPATADQVFKWFGNGTPRNVGIVTGAVSGVVVVDSDNEAAEAWAAANLPATPMQVKTKRGRHRYFKHPNVPVRNRARIDTGDPAVLIDVRGDGGFVVGPGSQHASGITYQRLGPWPPIDTLPVFDRTWLETGPPKPLTSPAQAPSCTLKAGERNEALTRWAGKLRHIGLDFEEMDATLQAVNLRRCGDSPLPACEVSTIAQSIGRKPAGDSTDEPAALPALISDLDMLALPPLQALVAGWMTLGSLVAVYGPPESGKSLLLLLLAFCVANGLDWLGLAVATTGPVVYASSEGLGGMPARTRAVKTALDLSLDRASGVWTLPAAVDLLDTTAVGRFVDAVRTLSPVLIILDTLARCLSGGDENSAGDMGRAIRSCDWIRRETGATVILAHHTRADGERERGSSSLRGACDTMIENKVNHGEIVVSVTKQKDMERPARLTVRVVPVEGTASVTVRLAHTLLRTGELSEQQRRALHALREGFGSEGATIKEWETVSKVPRATLYPASRKLLKRGLVRQEKKRWMAL